jgi:hypothetical protein
MTRDVEAYAEKTLDEKLHATPGKPYKLSGRDNRKCGSTHILTWLGA